MNESKWKPVGSFPHAGETNLFKALHTGDEQHKDRQQINAAAKNNAA